MMMQSAKFTRNWQLLGFAPGTGKLPVKSIGMDFSVKTPDSTWWPNWPPRQLPL